MKQDRRNDAVSRRSLLAGGLVAAGGAALYAGTAIAQQGQQSQAHDAMKMDGQGYGGSPGKGAPSAHGAHGAMVTIGEVDPEVNGFDPHKILTDFDTGTVETGPDGRTIRTFEVTAEDKDIMIAPGVTFSAWTYNGRVPGPTLRATEGDRIRINFKNYGSHPHSMHFHGIHSARMDGIPGTPGMIDPGDEFTYEFDAKPFGCHLYHCHMVPLRRHLHKGMYGTFIIDPDPTKHPEQVDVARSRLLGTLENAGWQELVMVMNGFDTDFDEGNEFYAVNTVSHAFAKKPIKILRSKPVRIYLVNVLEFDLINSFHLHANFYNYFNQGTNLTPTQKTIDLISLTQAERGILEFTFAEHEPGLYMFHPHQTEFTELGWMGMFDVVETLA